jgi:glutathione S-transferase
MIPAEARARARTVWFDEFADTILFPVFVKLFVNRVVTPKFRGQPGDQAAADAAERDELPPLLAYLERTVPDSGFLVEDRLTLADLAVASPFINIAHAGFDLAASPYPKTAAYVAGIVARPSFAVHVAKETAILAR